MAFLGSVPHHIVHSHIPCPSLSLYLNSPANQRWACRPAQPSSLFCVQCHAQPAAKVSDQTFGRLMQVVKGGDRHPLAFGREVLASLGGVPDRADWRACQVGLCCSVGERGRRELRKGSALLSVEAVHLGWGQRGAEVCDEA